MLAVRVGVVAGKPAEVLEPDVERSLGNGLIAAQQAVAGMAQASGAKEGARRNVERVVEGGAQPAFGYLGNAAEFGDRRTPPDRVGVLDTLVDDGAIVDHSVPARPAEFRVGGQRVHRTVNHS
jgi:hypothetical protein